MSDFERIGPRNKIENIEVDEVQIVDDLCDAIRGYPKRKQLKAISDFLNMHLLNALESNAKIPQEIKNRVWDQQTTKALSTVLKDRWGVCLDWHVVGQAILNKLGIETVFQVGRIPRGPAHTYLDVKLDEKWEVFDPFAERYLRDQGVKGKQFQGAYYLNSRAYSDK